MVWWTATAVVAALSGGAIALRSSLMCFGALTAFVPLALHTLYNDFGRFWVLIVVSLAIMVCALARNARHYRTPSFRHAEPAGETETA